MASRAQRRRRLSLTSLIDVIFLLLLFFMLSSTFTRFAEIELSAAVAGAPAPSAEAPLFLQLGATDLRLNGAAVALEALAAALAPEATPDAPRALLVSLRDDVTAQRLTDLLAALRGAPGIAPTILGRAPQ